MKVVNVSKRIYVRYLGEYRNMRTPESVVEVSTIDIQSLDIPKRTESFQFFEKEIVQLEDGMVFEADRKLSEEYKIWEPPRGSYKP